MCLPRFRALLRLRVFMMPLSRQDDFFVAEFQEDEVSIATTDRGESILEKTTDCNERERGSSASSTGSDGSNQEDEDMVEVNIEEEGERGVEEILAKSDSEEKEPLPVIGSETVPDVSCRFRD